MVAFLLSLRFVMLVASTGAALGAVLMFWLGATKLIAGIRTSFHGNEASSIAGAVMGATERLSLRRGSRHLCLCDHLRLHR